MSSPARAVNNKGCVEGAASEWFRERVDLCMYVEKLDFHRDHDPTVVCDSYRKIKWVRDKQRRRLEALEQQQKKQDQPQEAAQGSGPLNTAEELLISAEGHDGGQLEDALDSPIEASNDPLDVLVGDVLRGYNLSVTCCGALPAHGSDLLEAISKPCIREGRVVQDTSILFPRAVRTKPMQLERARYTFSDSVYSFDVASSTWTRRECSGREPRGRSDHSALFMGPHHLLIFGGRGRNDQVFRDFFALSLEMWHWTQLDTSATPYERYWHGWCLAFDSEQPWQQEPSIFLFGGKSDTLVYSDLHQLQTTRLKRMLADEEEHGRVNTRDDEGETAVQRMKEKRVSDAARLLLKEHERQRLPAWFVPDTVGKPPSARFGMQVLSLENEQLAVVGGWRIRKRKVPEMRRSRALDVHILDLTTLVWSTPKLSTLVCAQPYVPSERLLFECFYVNQTLVLFGGHSYASNGETESFTTCADASTTLYKLDVGRMIWRQQPFPATTVDADGVESAVPLPAAHSHGSSNAVLRGRAFTCSSEAGSLELQLSAFDVRRR